MYWGAGRLAKELGALVSDYTPSRIDGAAYRLRIGAEVYVSPTGEPHDPKTKTKTQLSEGQAFAIPPGQFGFLLTEESVKVPHTAIGFISIRAGYKFAGLVNVSGFHVDPNYTGRLIFAVFNAGPSPIHLARGEECFLIWYADLDDPNKKDSQIKKGYDALPSHMTGAIGSGVQSFDTLLLKINDNDKQHTDRLNTLERDVSLIKFLAGAIFAAVVGLIAKEVFFNSPVANNTPAVSTSVSVGQQADKAITHQTASSSMASAVTVPSGGSSKSSAVR